MAVGLMNGATGVNWRRFATIFGSWVVTMPLVGIYSGLLFAFMASNPSLYVSTRCAPYTPPKITYPNPNPTPPKP
jgi:hypothetical protein